VPEERRALFVVLSGPSGVGKDSILDELERRGHDFHRVVTVTTRAARAGERDGVEYHFVSDADFDQLLDGEGLLEHAVVYGHRYGVPKQQVLDALDAGRDVFVRTDVQGAASIKRLMPEAVLVFVSPASLEDLEDRLRKRGTDDETKIQRRLETAKAEMGRTDEYEHVLVNAPGGLGAAVDQFEGILEAARTRPR
jgi:guanylate kinase